MIEHELKCWPEYFRQTLAGNKTFEYRKNDREFQFGDTLLLKEYDPVNDIYTGRYMRLLVTAIYFGLPELPKGYCIMQTKLLDVLQP